MLLQVCSNPLAAVDGGTDSPTKGDGSADLGYPWGFPEIVITAKTTCPTLRSESGTGLFAYYGIPTGRMAGLDFSWGEDDVEAGFRPGLVAHVAPIRGRGTGRLLLEGLDQ